MPSIPIATPLGYVGVFLVVAGLSLIIAGLGILKLEKITIAPGRRTWAIGLLLAFLGVLFLMPDIRAASTTASPQPGAAPSVSLTPNSTAAPLPSGILFQERFNGGEPLGWTDFSPAWRAVNNQYECIASLSSAAHTVAGNNSWGDYYVSAKIRLLPRNIDSRIVNLGVTGRIQDGLRFYLAQLRDGLARIVRSEGVGSDQAWMELANAPYTVRDDVWYDLQVEFRGPSIKMYIDNQLVTSANDSTYEKGGIGLRCAEMTEAAYDDIAVKDLSRP